MSTRAPLVLCPSLHLFITPTRSAGARAITMSRKDLMFQKDRMCQCPQVQKARAAIAVASIFTSGIILSCTRRSRTSCTSPDTGTLCRGTDTMAQ
ncbi:hypothetical protein B0H10DRAFT_828291 [Mycena sp. CBHHK59/15]|nr:hypothetical protein B0H10DRAFT_828291 [Mycena sp. CBHHK59/15]